ncbi:Ger(x)C family spore germination protein [Paenibacillus humicola]|uniref:Ger(x)C family spore germination protein n=1 Tax=Paenibacillus humicola TaxID=3110540 RepID=UPI00237BE04B|nr:Ger(x)C family spore germination protein [Paenibacillus humicola]
MKKIGSCFALLLIVPFATGCWNQKEPNQVAFVIGGAMDLTKDGRLEVSNQIAIPSGLESGQDSGGGSMKKSFRVVSATGKNLFDTAPNLQVQLSRRLFVGHRRVILVGQRLAEHGIGDLLDEFIRNPQSELRSRIFIAKGVQGKNLLSAKPVFEPLAAESLTNGQAALGLKPFYFHDFLSDVLSEGLQPVLPAFSLTASNQIVFAGMAAMNKDDGLKLAGFLNIEESSYANWITNRQTGFEITSFVPEGKGNVTLNLKSLGSRIRAETVGDRIRIHVRLTGKGTVVENNTSLNPTKRADLRIIQDELGRVARESVQQMIEKVQKQYKTDIFGFGEHVHWQYPHRWKTLKRNWNKTFPKLDVSVDVKLYGKDPGETGSSVKLMP